MSVKNILTQKLAEGSAAALILSRRDAGLVIPNNQAVRASVAPGSDWKNLALVGVVAQMTGAGRLGVYRGGSVTTWGTSGGFDSDSLYNMTTAHGASITYGIDAGGYRGIPFTDRIDLDLWEWPILIRKETLVAATHAFQLAIQNDSGASKGYAMALKIIAWR